MVRHLRAPLVLVAGALACATAQRAHGTEAARLAEVRSELERLYQQNADAYMRFDLAAVMALRAPGFHSVTPDGLTHDRAAMERYIAGFMNGVRRWNATRFTIDSLRVSGDTAVAVVSQFVDRMALRPDDQVHHVQTWVTQRETWVRSGTRWLMWRVDQLRNQRRLVDGRPGGAQDA